MAIFHVNWISWWPDIEGSYQSNKLLWTHDSYHGRPERFTIWLHISWMSSLSNSSDSDVVWFNVIIMLYVSKPSQVTFPNHHTDCFQSQQFSKLFIFSFIDMFITSGHSDFTTDRIAAAHGTVQLYSPGCANVHSHLIHASLDPSESKSQTGSRSVQLFLHSSRQKSCYTLQRAAPSHGGSGPPSNTWFLEPTRVLKPNGISIGSTVFAGLATVMEWP